MRETVLGKSRLRDKKKANRGRKLPRKRAKTDNRNRPRICKQYIKKSKRRHRQHKRNKSIWDRNTHAYGTNETLSLNQR